MTSTAHLGTAFKQTAEGWIYAPAIAIMGPRLGTRFGTQYLVDDAQKSAITASFQRWQRAMSRMCLVYAILCGMIAILMMGIVFGFWTPDVLPRVTLPNLNPGLAGLLFALPLLLVLAVFPFVVWHARAGAPVTAERIVYEDVVGKTVAASSLTQIKTQLGMNLLFIGIGTGFLAKGIEKGEYVSAFLWAALIVFFAGLAVTNIKLLKAKRAMDTQNPSNC